MPTSSSVPEMMHNVGHQDNNQNNQNGHHQRKLSNSLNGIDQQHLIHNHQRAEGGFPSSNTPEADQTFPNGGNYVAPDYDDQSQQDINSINGRTDDDDDDGEDD